MKEKKKNRGSACYANTINQINTLPAAENTETIARQLLLVLFSFVVSEMIKFSKGGSGAFYFLTQRC